MRRWLIGPGALTLAAVIFALWLKQLSMPFDTDLFWQIPEGVQILHGHFPTTVPYAIHTGYWVDHEWLFETVAAWSWQRGIYPAFALLCVTAFTLAPAFVYALLRRLRFSDVSAAASAAVFAASETVGPAVRARTFAYYLFALELFIFYRGLRRPWILLPLGFVWANVHASAVMAVGIAVVFAVGQILEKNSAAAVRSLYGSVFAFIGTLLTPIHVHLWTYSLLKSVPTFASAFIQEWRAVSFSDGVAWFVFVPVAVAAIWGWRSGRNIPTTLLVVAFFILAADHIRHTPFLALASMTTIGAAVELTNAPRRIEDRGFRLPAMLLIPIVLVAAFLARPVLGARPDPPGPWTYAADEAARLGIGGNVYATYQWAAYLHFRNLPVRVLIDAHGDPFGPRTWSDYMKITTLQPGWLAALGSERINAVFAEDQSPIAQALRIAPDWKVSASNGGVDVFERTQK